MVVKIEDLGIANVFKEEQLKKQYSSIVLRQTGIETSSIFIP